MFYLRKILIFETKGPPPVPCLQKLIILLLMLNENQDFHLIDKITRTIHNAYTNF